MVYQNKYTLPDGRVVSRQYRHFLKSETAKRLHDEAHLRYRSKETTKQKLHDYYINVIKPKNLERKRDNKE